MATHFADDDRVSLLHKLLVLQKVTHHRPSVSQHVSETGGVASVASAKRMRLIAQQAHARISENEHNMRVFYEETFVCLSFWYLSSSAGVTEGVS